MKVLVTGSDGFIGSHVMERLPDAIGFDIKSGRDILVDPLPVVDVIIHLAAFPLVQECIKNPLKSHQINVCGTLKILEHCRLNKIKLIFASTAQASKNALNAYAQHKYQCEEHIKLYGEIYGLEYMIYKIHNVFGPREHGVIGAFLELYKNDQPLIIRGGQQRRDFIHVSTVVGALVDFKSKGIFELGSGQNLSVQEIADMISDDQFVMDYPKGEPMELVASHATPGLSVKEYLASLLKQ